VEASTATRSHRLSATKRQGERVSPLELFFDLVFVLAITQCTALMADNPTWEGIVQGLLVLGLLWWAWAAYAWLTSVLDPDAGLVRAAVFGSMAALLIAAICVPDAFGDLALEFVIAYAAVRIAHIALFLIASQDDPELRLSVNSIAVSTAIAIALLATGAVVGGDAQMPIWAAALVLDLGIPYLFRSGGWRLEPSHFAERHSLIVIIALGESIVAVGVGAEVSLSAGIAAAAAVGVILTAGMWWTYFDVVSVVSARRLVEAEPGQVQNELARDSYSYIHYVLVAGIVLVALGLKKTIGAVDDPLKTVPAFALLGGLAIYLLGLVMFRWRHVHTLNKKRLGFAIVLFASVPLATDVDSVIVVGAAAAVLWALIAVETRRYGEGRARIRAEFARGG
jgi:low temperature requirement protein LtrA